MEHSYKNEIRTDFIYFITRLKYVHQTYVDAERDRKEKIEDIFSVIRSTPDMPREEFEVLFGKNMLHEFYHKELFFKYLLLHSIFTSMYGLLDDYFLKFTERLQNSTSFRIKIADISKSGSDIERYRKYLHIVHGLIAADSQSADWAELNQFRLLRNSITHSNNHLKKNADKVLKFLERYKHHYNSTSTEFYILDDKFLEDFIQLAIRYMKQLVNEVAPVT